jgi:hypothetical protein
MTGPVDPGGLPFWDYVLAEAKRRTAEQRPEDEAADARAAALIRTLTATERAHAWAVARTILEKREEFPNVLFLSIAQRTDGSFQQMDDPTVASVVKMLIARSGMDKVPGLTFRGLTAAQEAEVYRVINRLDFSAYGIE